MNGSDIDMVHEPHYHLSKHFEHINLSFVICKLVYNIYIYICLIVIRLFMPNVILARPGRTHMRVFVSFFLGKAESRLTLRIYWLV